MMLKPDNSADSKDDKKEIKELTARRKNCRTRR